MACTIPHNKRPSKKEVFQCIFTACWLFIQATSISTRKRVSEKNLIKLKGKNRKLFSIQMIDGSLVQLLVAGILFSNFKPQQKIKIYQKMRAGC